MSSRSKRKGGASSPFPPKKKAQIADVCELLKLFGALRYYVLWCALAMLLILTITLEQCNRLVITARLIALATPGSLTLMP